MHTSNIPTSSDINILHRYWTCEIVTSPLVLALIRFLSAGLDRIVERFRRPHLLLISTSQGFNILHPHPLQVLLSPQSICTRHLTISTSTSFAGLIVFSKHLHLTVSSHIFYMAELVFPVTPGAVAVPTLALITLIIDTPPLIWHIRNRNLAASSLVFWVLISNLMNFVNALIWPTDDIFHWWDGSGLCDIEVKLMLAAGFGVIGSLACIMRSLATVLDTNRTILSPSKAQRRRKIIVDCLFCFGGPIYCMAFVYIVQPDRYWIFAISGCTATVSYSWPTIVLIEMWPPILCLVAVYYSGKLRPLFLSTMLKLTIFKCWSSLGCTSTAKSSRRSSAPPIPT